MTGSNIPIMLCVFPQIIQLRIQNQANLAGWLSFCLLSNWSWVRILLQSIKLQTPCYIF